MKQRVWCYWKKAEHGRIIAYFQLHNNKLRLWCALCSLNVITLYTQEKDSVKWFYLISLRFCNSIDMASFYSLAFSPTHLQQTWVPLFAWLGRGHHRRINVEWLTSRCWRNEFAIHFQTSRGEMSFSKVNTIWRGSTTDKKAQRGIISKDVLLNSRPSKHIKTHSFSDLIWMLWL